MVWLVTQDLEGIILEDQREKEMPREKYVMDSLEWVQSRHRSHATTHQRGQKGHSTKEMTHPVDVSQPPSLTIPRPAQWSQEWSQHGGREALHGSTGRDSHSPRLI